jgi:hypothetical protein
LNRYRRMDTTSFKVEGEDEREGDAKEEAEQLLENRKKLEIVRGFSKDGRPDLKQFMLS